MMRLRPWEAPWGGPGADASRPSTRGPRRARARAVALPITPSPTTMASYVFINTPSARPVVWRRGENFAAVLGDRHRIADAHAADTPTLPVQPVVEQAFIL